MALRFKLIFIWCMVFITTTAIAQETFSVDAGDTKYREDQFYVGITYNLINSAPSDVKLRGLSGGIQFGYLRDMPINKKRSLAIALGAGVSFDQYGSTLFIGETPDEETIFTGLSNDALNVAFDSNRFNTALIEAPIEFRWRSSTAKDYSFWRVYAGFRVGYTYWYKATFIQTDNTVNQTEIPEYNRVRLNTTLSFGYSKINFYANYAINPFFKDAVTTNGSKVDFRSLKLGLIFYIL